ncbi:MAG: hypothetical protein IT159_10440 [Bryobacterales bacterium]|nr:hypothetical protein [Bryobacterales bacterium]
MAAGLPETIRVRLSSEEAGDVSLTPVVIREMPFRDLVELMLDVTGKNAARLRELLHRGTLVSGATRFRWEALPAEGESLEELLAGFPDPEPHRPFDARRCVCVRIEGLGLHDAIPLSALARRRLLRRTSFWDVLCSVAAEVGVEYAGYSYRDRADRYLLRIPSPQRERMRAHAGLLCYSTLETVVREARLREAVFVVSRGAVNSGASGS